MKRTWQTPLFRYDARAIQTDSVDDWQSVEVERRGPFEVQLELFLQGVAAAKPTSGLPTWQDAVANQRLIQAAYRSVAEQRDVRPDEIVLEKAAVA
jgi:predicted dehydrogenase